MIEINTKEMQEYREYCKQNNLEHPDFEDAHNMPREQMRMACRAFESYVKELCKLITPEMLAKPPFWARKPEIKDDQSEPNGVMAFPIPAPTDSDSQ